MDAGRKPKPDEIHQMEKEKLYGKAAERSENMPKAVKEKRPRCPQRLTKEQRKEWKAIAEILKIYNLFSIVNGPIMELLAIAMAQKQKCLKELEADGIVKTTINGNPVYNFYWSALNKLDEKILKCFSELGLSSTGMARLGSLVGGVGKGKKSKMKKLID